MAAAHSCDAQGLPRSCVTARAHMAGPDPPIALGTSAAAMRPPRHTEISAAFG